MSTLKIGTDWPAGSSAHQLQGRRAIRGHGLSLRHGVLLAGSLLIATLVPGKVTAQAPGFGGGRAGGPGLAQEVALVDRFDTDADGRLNTAERVAARTWLADNGGAMGGGGGGGGRGFAPPQGAGGPGGFGGGGRGGRGGGGGARTVAGTPGPKVTPADVPSYANAPLYDKSSLRTLFIQFENEGWEQELAAFYNTDVEVPATVSVDGRTYAGVGIHFRGASSFRQVSEGSKRSLNLAFDFTDDDQRLGGYRTLNLLNANSDPTFVRTVLYSLITRSQIAAPNANFVQVVINGESWGVYINLQQFNKDFLADFFPSNDGARWKVPGSPNGRGGLEYLGDDPAAYKSLYEIKTKDDAESWASLINLTKVLNQTPPEQLEAALAPILDVDATLKFLAIENALVNTDGYWTRASDYSLYLDPDGRFHVVPHDMNEGLGSGGNVELSPLAAANDASKPLISKLLAVPALRERYLGYVRGVATSWLDWSVLEPLVKEYQGVIATAVAADTRKLYSTADFEANVAALRQFVEQRREFLLK